MLEKYYDRNPLWTEESCEAELRQRHEDEKMRERLRSITEEEESNGTAPRLRVPGTSDPE
jgi:hypothetical protein